MCIAACCVRAASLKITDAGTCPKFLQVCIQWKCADNGNVSVRRLPGPISYGQPEDCVSLVCTIGSMDDKQLNNLC